MADNDKERVVCRNPDPELVGAVARGWCSEANEGKEMDPDLAYDIACRVEEYLAARRQPASGEAVYGHIWRNPGVVEFGDFIFEKGSSTDWMEFAVQTYGGDYVAVYTTPVASGEPGMLAEFRNITGIMRMSDQTLKVTFASARSCSAFHNAWFEPRAAAATPQPTSESEKPAAEKEAQSLAENAPRNDQKQNKINSLTPAEKEAQGGVNFGADVELGRLLDAHRAAKADHSIPQGLTEFGRTRKALIHYLNAKFKAATQPAAQAGEACPLCAKGMLLHAHSCNACGAILGTSDDARLNAALPQPAAQSAVEAEFVSEEVQVFAIGVEKRLCAALGRRWSSAGISIDSLIAELVRKAAAAQAQPVAVLEDALTDAEDKGYTGGYRVGLLEGASVARELYVNHVYHTGVDGLLARCHEAEQYLITKAEAEATPATVASDTTPSVDARERALEEAAKLAENMNSHGEFIAEQIRALKATHPAVGGEGGNDGTR
jgi:hypothetical protein